MRAAAQEAAARCDALAAERSAALATLKSRIGKWVGEIEAAEAASREAAEEDGRPLARRPLLDPDLHRDVRVRRQLRRRQPQQRRRRRLPDPALDLGPLRRPGRPQNAPKAEQDRIAAEIWADSGGSAWVCAS